MTMWPTRDNALLSLGTSIRPDFCGCGLYVLRIALLLRCHQNFGTDLWNMLVYLPWIFFVLLRMPGSPSWVPVSFLRSCNLSHGPSTLPHPRLLNIVYSCVRVPM